MPAQWSTPYFLRNVLEHLAAPTVGEVRVDVGHAQAVGVQKALKEETVAQWLDVSNAKRKRNNTSRRAATTRADEHTVVFCPRNVVGHD